MSHFQLGVIIKDLEELESVLEPFDESLKVEPYINETAKDIIASIKQLVERYRSNKEPRNDYIEMFLNCKTDEDFLKTYIDFWKDDELFDQDGNQLTTHNPNSKWDYWRVCEMGSNARFQNPKIPKGYCKVKNLTLKPDQKQYKEMIRFWELVVEEQPLKEGEEKPFNLYSKEHYIEQYRTKENFAYMNAMPYALLVDGKWYEKGKMGWFGLDDSTRESKETFLEKYYQIITDKKYQNYYIVFVDCHI